MGLMMVVRAIYKKDPLSCIFTYILLLLASLIFGGRGDMHFSQACLPTQSQNCVLKCQFNITQSSSVLSRSIYVVQKNRLLCVESVFG